MRLSSRSFLNHCISLICSQIYMHTSPLKVHYIAIKILAVTLLSCHALHCVAQLPRPMHWIRPWLYWLCCHSQETAQLLSLVVVTLEMCISLVPSHLTAKISYSALAEMYACNCIWDWCNEEVAWACPHSQRTRLAWATWIVGIKSVICNNIILHVYIDGFKL